MRLGLFKFKDKTEWRLDNPHEWSSQPVNGDNQDLIWDDDEVGKTVSVGLTPFASSFSYNYQIYIDGEVPNITFRAEAFENSMRLPRREEKRAEGQLRFT